MSSLKHKTVSGFKWLVFNHFAQRVIRVISFAILARILNPSVFGLFAMAFIAIDGFALFKSFGIDGALIQRKEDDPTFESAKHTAFFLVQIIGLVIFAIFQLSAPLVAAFVRNQEVLTIMRVLGVIFIIGNLGRIPNAMLTKHMRFQIISWIDLATSLLNSVLSVVFALMWPNVWSLVLAYLCKQIFSAIVSWYYEPYKVRFVFDRRIAGELFHFGKYLVGMGFIGYVSYNLDNFLISRYLGVVALGYYVLAMNITSFTHIQVMQHLGRVLFPAMAAIKEEPEIIKRAYLKTVRFVSIVAIPFTVGIMAVAKDFVLALYGENWLPIVPLIQMLAISQVLGPILGAAGSVFQGCGKPNYAYSMQLWRLIIKLPLLIVMAKAFGIYGVAYTAFILQIIFAPIVYALVQRLVRFSFFDFMKQLVPSMICSFCMLVSVYGVKFLLKTYPVMFQFDFHHLLPMVLFAIIGIPTYIISYYFVDRSAVKEVFRLVFRMGPA